MVFYRGEISAFVSKVVGKDVPGLKHAILFFLISYPLALFFNIFFTRKFSFDYTIERWGTQLEKLFWRSVSEVQEEDKMLMLTTKSNKIYIGIVNKISQPIGEPYISIMPSFSGYRNKETLRLELTTRYTDIRKAYILKDRVNELDEKLGIILPISEILIVSRFDNEIFGWFNDNPAREAGRPLSIRGRISQAFSALFR
ncbi:hypothetical protein [Hufsiella ginkgonis]|uniref:Uncharacterized protein n=1 Tax=Hufsiella ginkgonis TaxID=2695274 RepID=A0A7K1Y1P2_9SPHI|nr:hypothetical protein [Hufsiella ginkgonis]MXV17122.1 hypothetical protein [Hufsiella ginkgonis]